MQGEEALQALCSPGPRIGNFKLHHWSESWRGLLHRDSKPKPSKVMRWLKISRLVTVLFHFPPDPKLQPLWVSFALGSLRMRVSYFYRKGSRYSSIAVGALRKTPNVLRLLMKLRAGHENCPAAVRNTRSDLGNDVNPSIPRSSKLGPKNTEGCLDVF